MSCATMPFACVVFIFRYMFLVSGTSFIIFQICFRCGSSFNMQAFELLADMRALSTPISKLIATCIDRWVKATKGHWWKATTCQTS